MKAVQIEEFGGPEVLKTAEIPTPEAGEDEVLIELWASGVNRSDILTRSGSYHAAGRPPIVPGFEGSGIVREPGPAATGISSGDRVLAFGGRPGFYAEYVAVPTRHVVKMPEDLARIIHERSVGLRFARRKIEEYADKVADSLHHRRQRPKIGFPLFITNTQLRE